MSNTLRSDDDFCSTTHLQPANFLVSLLSRDCFIFRSSWSARCEIPSLTVESSTIRTRILGSSRPNNSPTVNYHLENTSRYAVVCQQSWYRTQHATLLQPQCWK